MLSLERIRDAAERAAPHVLRTPVVPAQELQHLKLECLQPAGSFKVRGFFAAALALPRERRSRGISTVSAGNAAAAAAYVASQLGIVCRVLMFEDASRPKVEAVRRWGGTPVFRERSQVLDWMAREGWREEPETFIHPFADEELIAGHGAIGLELAAQLPDLQRVLVPVGGGGLISGVAEAVKAVLPAVEVIGVQSSGYPLWPEAIGTGGPVHLTPETIADGTAAPYDPRMFERMRRLVDRWLVVPEPRLRAAVAELAAAARVVSEGAGALAFAALEQLPPGKVTAAVVSGGNIDRRLLAELVAP